MSASDKQEIVALLRELGQLTLLDEQNPQSFRVRAYENAVHGLEEVGDAIAEMTAAQLVKISGIGRSTAKKIREYFDTGTITKLQQLRATYPPAYVQLSKIPGLGPKGLAKLRAQLGVENLDDLRAALAAQTVRTLPGFGAKSEEKLAKAIERLGMIGKDRRAPIAEAMAIARRIVAMLEAMPEVQRAQYCGSLRRLRETIGDVDIVLASDTPAPIMTRITELPIVSEVIGTGTTKTSFVTHDGMQVDVRVVAPEQFGAAILYFTGSKAHNIKLRQRALDRGWTLNEYALSDVESGRVLASRTEQDIYEALALPFIDPTMREDTGEIEAGASDALPEQVDADSLRGDLHVHTSLSGDGRSSLEQVLDAASARGYEYVAITEHAEDLTMNGVGREALLAQRAELRALESVYPHMTLLHGIELNIGADGGLDYDAEFRGSFDWCVAAVHSHFDLDRDRQTARIIRAMEDPAVHVIGHLTGRMIGRRPGIELDIDAVLEAAGATGTAIEINSALQRLDAATDVLRRARELGVAFVISSDAHHVDQLERVQWGRRQARRGWVDRRRVANTWPRDQFLAWVRGMKAAAS